jgi:hypothetical protein
MNQENKNDKFLFPWVLGTKKNEVMKRVTGEMKVGILLEKTNKTRMKRQLGRMRKLKK